VNRPLVEGVDYTVEDGKLVFTAHYLRERGHCCNSGCRNCPYRDETAVERIQIGGPREKK
jgi:hypothetical protein